VESSPAILNDTLYVGSQDGNIYAFHSDIHDVAVLNVTSAPSTVFQGTTVNVTVTLRNLGTFNETATNVTIYYDGNIANTFSVDLGRGPSSVILNLPWNTSSVPAGSYTIAANATLPLTGDDDPSNNYFSDGVVEIKTSIHDVASKDVDPYKTLIGKNYTMNITVTVQNKGGFSEFTNVTLYANTSVIASENFTLEVGALKSITFAWDTTSFYEGNYTISVVAEIGPIDVNMSDNELADGTVKVGVPCDVTGPTPGVPDGICDMRDIAYFCARFLTTPASDWDPNCDVTGPTARMPDGKVDMRDIADACSHFLEEDP
jgi:hypothetical protein